MEPETQSAEAEILIDSMIKKDTWLEPYKPDILRRIKNTHLKETLLSKDMGGLKGFATGHHYFGLNIEEKKWVFREWAPNATQLFFIGDFSSWQVKEEFSLKRLNANGVWEIKLPGHMLKHGDLYRLFITWNGGEGDRIPSYAKRVVQDPDTLIFNAQVWKPASAYPWKFKNFLKRPETLLIYETHVGMAQDELKIGTYREFTEKMLPRIVDAGYNTIQLMAIKEHPYYASFGYHVSSFFAPSSKFGTPDELKELIDTAHEYGLFVIMDMIHSHAVNNETEGLSKFDGTFYQYFHDGPRGKHIAWDSRCFDYSKNQVLHFLLSNCRFWIEEYHFDGFRFDGITSMLYKNHGMEKAFTSYWDYFDENVDEDALTYLTLANRIVHDINPNAITIAEDISGMPGLAVPVTEGGFGFDYRLAMGIPDYWIKIIKEYSDEKWPLNHIWYELNNRREDEKTISYTESHDQALVGDQTLIFRMMNQNMYHHMHIKDNDLHVERGIALHKMIRLITLATAGSGYMNFMGNEFGHPEWIDFPREGNGWSYFYARRQWHLCDHPDLKYRLLAAFDRNMIAMAQKYTVFTQKWPFLLHEHMEDKMLAFARGDLIFVFNFHPNKSHVDYRIEVPSGKYRMILDSDSNEYGGHGRLTANQVHFTVDLSVTDQLKQVLSLYIPTRTAIVLEKI
ncbi:MAG: alpha amylase C-terminal domain-containing protein [Proteobacteria bacterium]|nr:alpha amylase C-terminal domain-containing protein [Pseudomonadota bacterium]